ncbi:MAG: glucose-6-phosphate isomerase [Polyangiales bacterium]
MLKIALDYAYAMRDGTPGGLDRVEFDRAQPSFEAALDAVLAKVTDGTLGFWDAPADAALGKAIADFAARVPAEVEDVLVLGIGGSSLGTRAIMNALAGPPELTYARPGRRIHLPDNSDPWVLAELLRLLAPGKTLALAVSKSGGTVETAAQVLVVREWLEKGLGAKWTERFAVVTDPNVGPLREMARAHDLAAFDVPSNIGGRFSVLTAVGLLPAAMAGLDVAGVLRGAASMAEQCRSRQLASNPAGVLAVVSTLQHRLHGRNIHVLMPYADSLRSLTAWFVQLWAESLGKRTDRAGRTVEVGPTPVPAIGATDQHAQMQLFMEGPRDKILTFIDVKERPVDLPIPKADGAFGYLGGHTLLGVLDAELRGTRLALARDGRPSMTVEIERVDAEHLGALFFLFEAATAIAGELYDINAFDQPGVEAGKRLAFGLLGRKGFEDARKEVEDAEACRPTSYRVAT